MLKEFIRGIVWGFVISSILFIVFAMSATAATYDYYFNYAIDANSLHRVMVDLDTIVSNAGTQDTTIRLYINSPGGLVTSSIAMYDYLKKLRREGVQVETHATGLCASGATIILQAGSPRYCTPHTMFLIHGVQIGRDMSWWQEKWERYKEWRYILYINETLVDIYQMNTRQSRTTLRKLMERDTWLFIDEAKRLHFIDWIEN